MTWLEKKPSYSIVKKQKNKVKGYQVEFSMTGGFDGVFLGFVKTLKEAKILIIAHRGYKHETSAT